MASTYSPNLRLELIGTGEQQGTWGITTNTNLGTLLEEAIGGYTSVTVTDGADTTLTTNNGSADQSRNMVINLTGALTAARNVICPAIEKMYVVKNATTGGFAVTFKVSGQTGVSIPNGSTYILYVNGTDAVLATGTIAAQNSNNVSITGGSITGITDLAVADGGTGASTAAGAATNLGLGTGDSPQFAAVNIGNATDTTITRVSAGVIAVEGKTVVTETGGQTVQFAAGSNTAPSITTTGDTNTGIYFPAADTIAFTEGGAEAMRIDSSGNVGIGTASPSQKLHVSGVGYFTDEIRGSNNLNLDKATLNTIFFTDALALAKSGTGERMRIDTSGNVGIGTSSPLNWGGSSLTLNQVSLSATFGVYTANAYYGGSPNAWRYGGNGIAWGIGNNFGGVTNGTTIAVAASNSGGANASLTWIPAFNIDSSGNVGINTSSPLSGAKLTVSGAVAVTGILTVDQTSTGVVDFSSGSQRFISYGASGVRGGFQFLAGTGGSAPTGSFTINTDSTLSSQATYDNTATGSTVVVTSAGAIRRTSSSIKYKKDIEDLDSTLSDNAIANLRPVWYRTKNAEGDDKSEWSHIGLIAEEVDQVEKRLVKYRTVEVTFDESGQRVETLLSTPEPEDVDYARLAVLLLDKMQRMDKTLQELKADFDAYKSTHP